VFVSNVINGNINSSEILQELQFKVPRISSRCHEILKEEAHKSTFGSQNPISWMKREFNSVYDRFDFHLTVDSFKSRLKM
jgi:hypothetical protein